MIENIKREFVSYGNESTYRDDKKLIFEYLCHLKYTVNELVDVVNAIQKEREAERFEIQEWIGILEAVRESVNIHEKQIDELQMKLEAEKCDIPDSDDAIQEVIHADPYAEQKKWIGKLCKFWDDDNTNSSCGILTSIDTETFEEPQFVCNDEYDYEHCEPVKPDDDVIYKGEQQ